ncbi:MAG TPA: hypothetical protein VEK06_02295, partial [Myxococcota bacterium]|nr:hypothetical protein [Myxococcota bacterium]
MEGADALINALKKNSTVIYLGINGNQISDDARESLQEQISINQNLNTVRDMLKSEQFSDLQRKFLYITFADRMLLKEVRLEILKNLLFLHTH